MNKWKYAGLSLAGFLLNIACAAAILGILLLTQEMIGLLFIGGLALSAGAGALLRLLRRVIRSKLHAKTTVFSLVSILLPVVLGITGTILGSNGAFSAVVDSWLFLGGAVLLVSAIFAGLFGSTFDKLFNN